jgi:hypothetical protein
MRPIKFASIQFSAILLVLVTLTLSACTGKPGVAGGSAATKEAPATKEAIGETGINKVTLTAKAIERLQIETGTVASGSGDSKVIPYSAIIYDLKGATWAYTNPEANVYIRQAITVDRIEGNSVYLSDGPALGTAVVTLGAALLYGTDSGITK